MQNETEGRMAGKNDTPTCTQIDRACRLYSAGASSHDMRAAFAGELTEHGMALEWCAAVAAFNVDERHPFTSNRKH